jgi:cytochrome c peroxidase
VHGSTIQLGSRINIIGSCYHFNGERRKLQNGIEQFVNYDEDSKTELMMLLTDIALTQDKRFKQYVEIYARDKERFFADFSKAFEKLVKLGIARYEKGTITNTNK